MVVLSLVLGLSEQDDFANIPDLQPAGTQPNQANAQGDKRYERGRGQSRKRRRRGPHPGWRRRRRRRLASWSAKVGAALGGPAGTGTSELSPAPAPAVLQPEQRHREDPHPFLLPPSSPSCPSRPWLHAGRGGRTRSGTGGHGGSPPSDAAWAEPRPIPTRCCHLHPGGMGSSPEDPGTPLSWQGGRASVTGRGGTPYSPFSSTAQPLASGYSPHSRRAAGSAAHPAPAAASGRGHRRWLAEGEGPCAAGSGCSSPPERGGGVKPAGSASPCARRADELAPFSPAGYFYPAPLGFAPSFSTSLPGVALRSRSPPGAPAARAGRRLSRAEGTGTRDTAGGWLCRKTPFPACRSSLLRTPIPAHAWHSPPPSLPLLVPWAPQDAEGSAGGEDALRGLGSLSPTDAADHPLFFLKTSPPSLFLSFFLPACPRRLQPGASACLLSRRLRLSVHPPRSFLPFPPGRPALDDASPPFFCSLPLSLPLSVTSAGIPGSTGASSLSGPATGSSAFIFPGFNLILPPQLPRPLRSFLGAIPCVRVGVPIAPPCPLPCVCVCLAWWRVSVACCGFPCVPAPLDPSGGLSPCPSSDRSRGGGVGASRAACPLRHVPVSRCPRASWQRGVGAFPPVSITALSVCLLPLPTAYPARHCVRGPPCVGTARIPVIPGVSQP